MSERVLVTGGAGFVGSHVVDALLVRGYEVRVLDDLVPQVHGPQQTWPSYLDTNAELIRGTVVDRETVRKAIGGCTALIHLAASVGVGQSMYEIASYVQNNAMGAATILDVLVHERHTIRKMVVASSMSTYGEGKYRCASCAVSQRGPAHLAPRLRQRDQLERHDWEVHCPTCGAPADPVPTDEEKPLFPTSVYAITKRDHEELFLTVGLAYEIPTVALRFFNIYGERQSLSNPYTGVAAIFASRLLNRKRPIVFEDGLQSRDLVHVSDVAEACVRALSSRPADGHAINVGTGERTTLLELLGLLRRSLDPEGKLEPEITGRFREGDIRHCYADMTKARALLGVQPKVSFRDGVALLIAWATRQEAIDRADTALTELSAKRLIR